MYWITTFSFFSVDWNHSVFSVIYVLLGGLLFCVCWCNHTLFPVACTASLVVVLTSIQVTITLSGELHLFAILCVGGLTLQSVCWWLSFLPAQTVLAAVTLGRYTAAGLLLGLGIDACRLHSSSGGGSVLFRHIESAVAMEDETRGGSLSPPSLSLSWSLWLLITALGVWKTCLMPLLSVAWNAVSGTPRGYSHDYVSIPDGDAGLELGPKVQTSMPKPECRTAASGARNNRVCNFFDPSLSYSPAGSDTNPGPGAQTLEQLPSLVAMTTHMVGALGFQADNARNQAEHAAMLLHNELLCLGELESLGTGSGRGGGFTRQHWTQAAESLHGKLFGNYSRWCERMSTEAEPVHPLFLRQYVELDTTAKFASYPDCTNCHGNYDEACTGGVAADANVGIGGGDAGSCSVPGLCDRALHTLLMEDILVFLLVWGEAANLRHCPECLCYLYHQCMWVHIFTQYRHQYLAAVAATEGLPTGAGTLIRKVKFRTAVQSGHDSVYTSEDDCLPLPPDYFLTQVVAPLYHAVAASAGAKGDHRDRRHYDDLNEFFWSRDCLKLGVFTTTPGEQGQDGNYAISPLELLLSSEIESEGDDGGVLQWVSAQCQLPIPVTASRLHVAAVLSAPSSNRNAGGDPSGWPVYRKTFVEKRSWLHALYSFHRLIELHLVMFASTAVLAFAHALKWGGAYTLHVLSFLGLAVNCLHIVWTVLQVWAKHPGAAPSAASGGGTAWRLAVGFALAVAQLVYYQRSFEYTFNGHGSRALLRETVTQLLHDTSTTDGSGWSIVSSVQGGVSAEVAGASFWYWQYVYVTALALGGYMAEGVLTLAPRFVTAAMASRSALVQAALRVYYPIAELYLAKSIHIGDNESSCGTGRGCLAAVSHFVTLETLQYVGFWVVPLVVKATFGYFVVVQPLVPATLLLYDDYMNGLQLSEGYTEGGSGNLLLSPSTQSLLLAIIAVFVRWFPAMLVYFLDMAIWFAVWSSMVGGGVALVERQGAVRDTPTLRNHFIRAPLCFCQKLLPASSSLSVDRGEHVSTMDLAGLIDQAGGERATTGGVVHERSALLGGQPSMSIGGGSSSSSHGSSHASSAKRSSYEPVSGDVSRSDQQYQVIAALKTSTSSSALNKLAGLRKNASSGALNKLGLSRGADSPDNSAQLEQGQVNQGQNTGALLASYLGDVRSQRWAAFSVVWDELILKLRATDHISNAQRDRYLFSRCHWLTIALAPASADTSATSRAGTSTGGHVYLPLFQTVEGIERAARLFKISSKALEVATKTSGSGSGNSSGSGNWVSGSAAERQELSLQEAEVERAQVLDDFSYRYHTRVTESEAVKELWALSCWLLTTILGSRHREQLLTCFTCAGEIREPQQWLRVVSGRQLQPLLNSLTAVVASIKQGLSKRKLVAPVPVSTSVSDSSASSGGLVTPVAVRVPLPGMVGGSGGGSGGGMRKSKSRGSLQTLMENPRSPTHAQAQAPLMDAFRDKTREELRALLQNLTRCICTDVTGDGGGVSLAPVAEQLGGILSAKDGFFWDNLYSSSMLDHCCVAGADRECAARMKHVLYKAHGLLVLRANQVELPAESEARRRTTFFVNSLFMDMPAAPAVPHSREYTCVTPYYSEDVLLSRSDLERRNSEGTSTLLYLQTLHKREWTNFLERMGAELQERPHLIFSSKHRPEPASSAGDSDNGTLTASSTAVGDGRQEWWEQQQTYETHTRIWASLRAQTLYRTVEGMMQSQDALRALRRLELASASASGGAYADVEKLVRLKFNYVIACQVYGDMRTNNDAKAQDIELLLERHPNLRLAYIDKVRSPTGLAFYSVLVKFDDSSTSSGISGSNRGTESSSNSTRHLQRSPSFKSKHCIREVFRVRLPGNPILGEGKPENQNHALIFTRGRHLQAVDMNQDGYFEEFLKMRNLLQHFERPEVAIVGFREHIFTGSVSSVANYMALQELSFVTLGQRVLYNPLRVRQHYGHPDLFNKLFVMTEGGMSKASRGINLSEDIFAGFNATLRGRAVLYKEYMQVGKGRDVGLQQTYKFEAKLAQGNAEQSLSRDMHRLCNRLDFFRLLSFYYGGIAHYMTNTLICYSLAVVVYTNTLLVLFSLESVNGRAMQLTSVLTMMLAGMGLLQTAPLAVTLFVERGLTHAATQLCYMVLSGGPLYFIFHIMTRAHYFQRTLAAGNASYKATGRGFV